MKGLSKILLIFISPIMIFSCLENEKEIFEPTLEITSSENNSYFLTKINIANTTGYNYYFLNGPIHFSGYFSDYNSHSSENISPETSNSINYFPIGSPNKEFKTISNNLIHKSATSISKIEMGDTLEILIKLKKDNNIRIFNSSQYALAVNIFLVKEKEIEDIISKYDILLNNCDDILEYSQDFEAELLLGLDIDKNTARSEREIKNFNYIKTFSIKDTVVIK